MESSADASCPFSAGTPEKVWATRQTEPSAKIRTCSMHTFRATRFARATFSNIARESRLRSFRAKDETKDRREAVFLFVGPGARFWPKADMRTAATNIRFGAT